METLGVTAKRAKTEKRGVRSPFPSRAYIGTSSSRSYVSASLSLERSMQKGQGVVQSSSVKDRKREKRRERGKGSKERGEIDGGGSDLRAEARRLGLCLRNEFVEHTFDPRYSSNVRLSPDRLTATGNKNWGTSLARCCCRQGSWYFEVTIGSSSSSSSSSPSSSSSSSSASSARFEGGVNKTVVGEAGSCLSPSRLRSERTSLSSSRLAEPACGGPGAVQPDGGGDGDEDESKAERSAEVAGEDAREAASGEKLDAEEQGEEDPASSATDSRLLRGTQKKKSEKEEKKGRPAPEPLAFPVVGWGSCRTLKNVCDEHPERFLTAGVDSLAPGVRVGWGTRLSNFLAPIGSNCFGYSISSFSPHPAPLRARALWCSDAAAAAEGAFPRGEEERLSSPSRAAAASAEHCSVRSSFLRRKRRENNPLFVVQAGRRRTLRRGFRLPEAGISHLRLTSTRAKEKREQAHGACSEGEARPTHHSEGVSASEDRERERKKRASTSPAPPQSEKPRHGLSNGTTADENALGPEERETQEETPEPPRGEAATKEDATEEDAKEKEALLLWEEAQDRLKEGDVVGCYIHLPGDEPPAILDDPRGLAQLWTFLQQGLLCDVTNDASLPRAIPYPNSFVSFSVNGLLFPRCFRDLCTAEFHPAVSLFNGASASLNLGPEFQFLSPAERRVFRPACEMPLSMYPLKEDLVKFWLLSPQTETVTDPVFQCTYRRQRTLAEVEGDWDRARTFARMQVTCGRLEFSTLTERREEQLKTDRAKDGDNMQPSESAKQAERQSLVFGKMTEAPQIPNPTETAP
ncbi:hypothetical protein TGDOM2_262850 [Toxoplasma gondii GAB2-2007-GAL-DOM2]|nr:hypothetical protein TGVEG_262850 [Toxoplasma gondii VEG]KFG49623.1 hypothetical protein TGDOM2_262850 [Toxoplasma gondii GAB2-2007-GAL-DOM2]CEL74168.1 TPA: hypothetical protein BN1205_071870 [Toxoplasma gondii VEG]